MTKKLIFVSGKGGTGKSTISLYLARKLALMGRKTLLVELGTRSSVQHLAEMSIEPSYHPQSTQYGFDLSLISGLDCLVDYVSSFVKTEKLTKYFFDNPVVRTLLDIAPGLDDLAILGKLTSHVRHHGPSFEYDHIIIDSHSTGSFLSMLMAPKLLSEMVSSGPLHTQSQKISETLMNSDITHTLFVSLFEDLPVDELMENTHEYQKKLNGQYSILMNKYLPKISISESDKRWSQFINDRYEKQIRLTNRVAQEYPQFYINGFVTKKLSHDLMSIKNGDEIFQLMNL